MPNHNKSQTDSALQLQAFLENAPDAIFTADLAGRYADVNDAGCRLLGYSKEEIVGKSITDLIPADEIPRLEESRRQMLAGGSHQGEWHLRRKDGTYVPVEVSANILPDGRWQGFARDITDRKGLENALRESEERLRVSLQASPVIVFNQDRRLKYTWIHNPKDPFQHNEVIGKTDFDLLSHEDAAKLAEVKRKVLETGRGTRTVVQTTIKGEAYWYDLTVEPLRDEADRIIGITCSTWDVTEKQRAIAGRDQVLGIVAHDLRSPLSTVLFQAAVLEQFGVGDHGRKSAEIIRRAAGRMNRLIDDLLDVVRLDEGGLRVNCRPIEVENLLSEALESHQPVARRAGINLRLQLAKTLPNILGDRDRLLQVLDNLIENALKFSDSGSTVAMAAERRGDKLLFRVADTGPGISSDQLAHLFDRFWQARAGDKRGAGLGLAISKGIVELHGGRIWAESEIGNGTEISFVIPVAFRLAD